MMGSAPSAHSHNPKYSSYVPNHSWTVVDGLQEDQTVQQMTIATYNVLADTWAAAGHPKMVHRRDRILEEMRQINADVFCFQEIEEYSLQYMLSQMPGFTGFHSENGAGEGLGCMWRDESVQLVSKAALDFPSLANQHLLDERKREQPQFDGTDPLEGIPEEQVIRLSNSPVFKLGMIKHHSLAQLLVLKCANVEVTVVNTHLWWGGFSLEANQLRQLLQMKLLMDHTGISRRFVVVGDFNADRDELPLQFCMDGRVSGDDPRLEKGRQARTWSWQNGADVVFPSDTPLQSVYSCTAEPISSHCSWNSKFSKRLDWILASPALTVLKTLDVDDPSQYEQQILPSDHQPMAVTFKL